jgi:catechol 2,3-dioxygenase-like lactoylglutathione lyase family enzyme
MRETLSFDHVNIRTARLAQMVAWYRRVLGLRPGLRPDFPFPGAWLYLGNQPYLHLVGVASEPPVDPGDLKLEHFALRGEDFEGFLAHLKAEGVAWELGRPPGSGLVQVNVFDPDGNHVHIDFPDPQA